MAYKRQIVDRNKDVFRVFPIVVCLLYIFKIDKISSNIFESGHIFKGDKMVRYNIV